LRYSRLVIVVTLFLLTACLHAPPESYQNDIDPEVATLETPALLFSPNPLNVNLGFSGSLKVYAKAVERLSGAYIEINYNKDKLSLLSVNPGNFIDSTENGIFFESHDPSTGTIEINTSYLGIDSTSVSGTKYLAVLVFTTVSSGKSIVQFTSNCELLDPDDIPIEIKGFGVGGIYAE